jgi:dTDP-4-amino-4,6-dideoxygalactose transaminase
VIPFNKPFIVGRELEYIAQAVASGKTSGNGPFTKRCQRFFEEHYGFTKCLLTTSGPDELEQVRLVVSAIKRFYDRHLVLVGSARTRR